MVGRQLTIKKENQTIKDELIKKEAELEESRYKITETENMKKIMIQNMKKIMMQNMKKIKIQNIKKIKIQNIKKINYLLLLHFLL